MGSRDLFVVHSSNFMPVTGQGHSSVELCSRARSQSHRVTAERPVIFLIFAHCTSSFYEPRRQGWNISLTLLVLTPSAHILTCSLTSSRTAAPLQMQIQRPARSSTLGMALWARPLLLRRRLRRLWRPSGDALVMKRICAIVAAMHQSASCLVSAGSAAIVAAVVRHCRVEGLSAHPSQYWLRRPGQHLTKTVRIYGASVCPPLLALLRPNLFVAIEVIARGAGA